MDGKGEPLRVVLAGHSGLSKKTVAENLKKEILRNEPEATVVIACAEDFIFDVPTFLARNRPDQVIEWRDSLSRVIDHWEMEGPKADYSFLLMHLTFQWHSHLISPLSWMLPPRSPIGAPDALEDTLIEYAINKFQPHYFVTLIDDIQAVQARIRKHGYEFRLRELLRWRDTETLMADILGKHAARRVNSKHYPFENSPIVAIRHPPSMLYKFLRKRDVPRVYASFPIGTPRSINDNDARQKVMAEIDRFRSILHDEFTVFDPLTIDEFPLQDVSKKSPSILAAEEQWPISAAHTLCGEDRGRMELRADDLEEVVAKLGGDEGKNEIARQTERRDFRLIDQSDFVIIYRPTYYKEKDGNWSRGTYHEALYSKGGGKPFIVVRDRENDSSLAADTLGLELSPASVYDEISNLHVPEQQDKALSEVIRRVRDRSSRFVSHRLEQ